MRAGMSRSSARGGATGGDKSSRSTTASSVARSPGHLEAGGGGSAAGPGGQASRLVIPRNGILPIGAPAEPGGRCRRCRGAHEAPCGGLARCKLVQCQSQHAGPPPTRIFWRCPITWSPRSWTASWLRLPAPRRPTRTRRGRSFATSTPASMARREATEVGVGGSSSSPSCTSVRTSSSSISEAGVIGGCRLSRTWRSSNWRPTGHAKSLLRARRGSIAPASWPSTRAKGSGTCGWWTRSRAPSRSSGSRAASGSWRPYTAATTSSRPSRSRRSRWISRAGGRPSRRRPELRPVHKDSAEIGVHRCSLHGFELSQAVVGAEAQEDRTLLRHVERDVEAVGARGGPTVPAAQAELHPAAATGVARARVGESGANDTVQSRGPRESATLQLADELLFWSLAPLLGMAGQHEWRDGLPQPRPPEQPGGLTEIRGLASSVEDHLKGVAAVLLQTKETDAADRPLFRGREPLRRPHQDALHAIRPRPVVDEVGVPVLVAQRLPVRALARERARGHAVVVERRAPDRLRDFDGLGEQGQDGSAEGELDDGWSLTRRAGDRCAGHARAQRIRGPVVEHPTCSGRVAPALALQRGSGAFEVGLRNLRLRAENANSLPVRGRSPVRDHTVRLRHGAVFLEVDVAPRLGPPQVADASDESRERRPLVRPKRHLPLDDHFGYRIEGHERVKGERGLRPLDLVERQVVPGMGDRGRGEQERRRHRELSHGRIGRVALRTGRAP